MRIQITCALSAAALLAAGPALAQEANPPVAGEIGFIFTTFMFLVAGFLVMFMPAGFAMLEAGLVRSKNVSMQCLKNIRKEKVISLALFLSFPFGCSCMEEKIRFCGPLQEPFT